MGDHAGATVLIVEDDSLIQELYQTRLGAQGYTTKVTGDGAKALDEILSEPPDIVLLDLNLPKLNGYDVLQQLKALPDTADIPVVILSNKGEPGDIDRAIALGACDYLVKLNASPKRVLEAISKALDERQLRLHPVRVGLRADEPNLIALARATGNPPDLCCPGCGERLLMELWPQRYPVHSFQGRLVCKDCP